MQFDNNAEKIRLDEVSAGWSSLDKEFAYVTNYTYKALKPYFKGNSCLELGSADGGMTQFLVHDFDQVVSVDGSQAFINKLQEKAIPNLRAICSFFEELKLTEKFDTVIMAHVLEHVDNPVQVLEIAKGFLKEGGVMLIDVPNADSFHRIIGTEMGLLKRNSELNETDHKLGHRRVYTVDLVKEHLAEAGIKVIHWGGHFLKVLSAGQMKDFAPALMDAFYQAGKYAPQHAAEIYFVCQKQHSL